MVHTTPTELVISIQNADTSKCKDYQRAMLRILQNCNIEAIDQQSHYMYLELFEQLEPEE